MNTYSWFLVTLRIERGLLSSWVRTMHCISYNGKIMDVEKYIDPNSYTKLVPPSNRSKWKEVFLRGSLSIPDEQDDNISKSKIT